MTSPDDELVRRIAQQIMLKVQFHDFGRRDSETGDFITSGEQIESLEEVCNDAARAAIAVVLVAMVDDSRDDMSPYAPDRFIDWFAERHSIALNPKER